MSVSVWRQDSPFGPLVAAVGPAGLCRLAFGGDEGEVVAALDARFPDLPVRAGRPVAPVARQLDQYFAGRRRSFELDVDLSLVGGFHRAVLETLWQEVGYGEVVAYGELAALAGRPGAARAAGHAMSRNPVPVVVPCHRVVASDRSLHHYGGGLDMKRRLLAMEGADARGVTSGARAVSA